MAKAMTPYFIQAPNLSEFPKLVHGFTTKELGKDYDRIAQKIKTLRSHIYSLEQIHSNHVVYLGPGTDLADLPPGDALVTDRKDIVIGVKTADCVPLLVYDNKREVVAAIHAGYKGLLTSIIQKTIRMMQKNFHCRFENMYVTLGPAISVKHYEVDKDLILEFERQYDNRFSFDTIFGPKPHLDLKNTARIILEDLGMDPLHFMDMNLCTFERADLFYSYRREPGEGRIFNFIGMVS